MDRSARRGPEAKRRLFAGLIVGGLVLAACGNSGDDDESSDTTVAPTEETTAATTADTEPAETTAGTEPVETTADTTADTEPADTEPAETEPNIGTFEPVEGVPGVTDEAINFAVLGTGPSNPLGYCLLECFQGGVQAYFDYQNGLGGVNGRRDGDQPRRRRRGRQHPGQGAGTDRRQQHLRHLRCPAAVRRLGRHRRQRHPAVHHVPRVRRRQRLRQHLRPERDAVRRLFQPRLGERRSDRRRHEGGLDRLRRVAGLQGLRQPDRSRLRQVRARRRCRVRVQERRPARSASPTASDRKSPR